MTLCRSRLGCQVAEVECRARKDCPTGCKHNVSEISMFGGSPFQIFGVVVPYTQALSPVNKWSPNDKDIALHTRTAFARLQRRWLGDALFVTIHLRVCTVFQLTYQTWDQGDESELHHA